MGHQGNSQPHVYLPASTSDLQGNQRGHIELMESPLGRFAALTFLTSAVSGTTPLLLSRLPLASGLLCLCFPRFSHCCPFSPARPRMLAPLAWAWHASHTVALVGVGFDSFIHSCFLAMPRHLQDLSFTSRD